MHPTASLICTGFNREKYLTACLYSVLNQNYRDFELIYVDDGSGDRSLEIAKQFAGMDERIKVYEQTHKGRAKALEFAHSQAKGKYLGWIDSDDMLYDDALSKTVEILEFEENIGLCYTDYLEIDASGRILRLGHRCNIPYSQELLLKVFMTFHFRLFRRSLFEYVGGIDTRFGAAIDYDLCLRLSEITEFKHLAEPLYYYRVHSNSMSNGRVQGNYAREAVRMAIERRKPQL